MNKIGFMQGRLSEVIDGKIQAFPWESWKSEFKVASELNLEVLEWTLDFHRLYENPLMSVSGRKEITGLMKTFGVGVNSLTGDCFMQAPFWKSSDKVCTGLKRDFLNICESCSDLGIRLIVVPLVDNGSIENAQQEQCLVNFILEIQDFLSSKELFICFETDYNPCEVNRFLGFLPASVVGINYDIGNSASLGYNPEEEFLNYGHRIYNVHVKDRKYKGGTVPLFEGAGDFAMIFKLLADFNYVGDYILQTARALDGDHAGLLYKYKKDIEGLILSCQS